MESHILGAALARRDSCALILNYLNPKDYSREFQILIEQVKKYYERDKTAHHVDTQVFFALLTESFGNKKHLDRFVQVVNEAIELGTSVVNVDEVILKGKLNAVGDKLAVALANKSDTSDLMEEYQKLKGMSSLDELNSQGTEVLTADDIEAVLSRKTSGEGTLKVYPLAFNDRLEGKAAGGHHIVTFARPEMGKTALNTTMSCGFAKQSADGIYFINEDRVEDVYTRHVSNLSGMSENQIKGDMRKAIDLAMERGLGMVRFISLAPGSPQQVEAFVDKYQPKWIVMDQLRNLNVKESNKVLQLEYATSAMRNIGKKYNALVVSTTQAGDSAEGKALLTMGDVDFSNTGVAAQADVLVGLGGTPNDVEQGVRYINLSKNKLSGRHESFPVKLAPQISRFTSMNEQ